MAKLIISLNNSFLGEFALNKDRITIGRRPSNDIHIDNLAISGEHAIIKVIGRDAFLEDSGSTNGTLVNGKRIHQHILQHGDAIELGKYQLRYINEAATGAMPAALPPAGTEKHSASPNAPANTPAATGPLAAMAASKQQVKPAEPQARARVQILNGASTGKEIILNKTVTTLGKPGLHIAVITRRSQGYFITHVEGQSHPVVNGKSVGVQAHGLKDQDLIELAGIKMKFSLPKV